MILENVLHYPSTYILEESIQEVNNTFQKDFVSTITSSLETPLNKNLYCIIYTWDFNFD